MKKSGGKKEFWYFKAQLLQGCSKGGDLGENTLLTLAGAFFWVSKDTCKHRGQGLQPLDPSALSPRTPYVLPSLHSNLYSWDLRTESSRRCRSCNWYPGKCNVCVLGLPGHGMSFFSLLLADEATLVTEGEVLVEEREEGREKRNSREGAEKEGKKKERKQGASWRKWWKEERGWKRKEGLQTLERKHKDAENRINRRADDGEIKAV